MLFVVPLIANGQKKSTIDSLTKLLEKSNDSNNIAIQKLLSWEYRNSDTSKAIFHGKQALSKAIKLNIPYEQSDILGRIGVYYRNQGNFSIAMDYYFKSLEIAKKNGYPKLEALELNNIGDIYYRLAINDQAQHYIKQAIEMSKKLNDEYNLSYVYHMLGLIYLNSSKYDSAHFAFSKSLCYRKKLNLKAGIASSYLGIGTVYYNQRLLDSCIIYYNNALNIFDQINDKVGLANTYKYFGDYYNQKEEYYFAIENFKKSLMLMKGFGLPQVKKDATEGLSFAYFKIKNYNDALKFYKISVKIKDSLINNINIQKITRITENLKYEIKTREQEIQTNSLNEKISNQRATLNFFLIALMILLSMFGVIIFFYREKTKANSALKLKNDEVDELNKILTQANFEIVEQKNQIEAQRDILQDQSDKLSNLNATKNKLFSIIAHDLRGPFNSINGLSEHIKENIQSISTDELEGMIEQINVVGNNTLRLLENLLDWAKMQTDQVIIYKGEIDLESLAQDTIYALQPIANNKKIKIKLISDETIINSDKYMISTVIRNLLSNSIKYSNQSGEIVITIKQEQDKVVLAIIDYGVGMTQDQVSKLFTSNVNQSTFGTGNEKGTGLGLAICNEFIKKLNGEIWATSEIGKGSTFYFSLPLS